MPHFLEYYLWLQLPVLSGWVGRDSRSPGAVTRPPIRRTPIPSIRVYLGPVDDVLEADRTVQK